MMQCEPILAPKFIIAPWPMEDPIPTDEFLLTIDNLEIKCGGEYIDVKPYNEVMPNNIKHAVVYNTIGSMINSDLYIVPEDHYFFLGDNRDCSRDSRFLSSVGYVHKNNLVGKARLIFFSNDTSKGSVLKIWNLNNSFRFKRLFKKLK